MLGRETKAFRVPTPRESRRRAHLPRARARARGGGGAGRDGVCARGPEHVAAAALRSRKAGAALGLPVARRPRLAALGFPRERSPPTP